MRKKRRYPLSIHITTLFLALVTAIGVSLITISYQHSQTLLEGTAGELSNENSLKLQTLFKQQVAPVLTTLDFMAMSSFISHQTDSAEKNGWLSSIDLVFNRNESLVALYYGSSEGRFTLYRPLINPVVAKQFKAPDGATMLFRDTDLDGRNEAIFYDPNMNVMSANIQYDNRYDPRVRPWYSKAEKGGEISLTEPYRFYWLQDSGVTFVRRSVDNRHVVAADFSLSGLSAKIKELAYSERSKLILFDRNFHPLASHQVELADQDSSQDIRLTLADSVFSGVLKETSLSGGYATKNVDNLAWSIAVTPVDLTDGVELYLAEATPQNDLMKDLLSMRDKQLVMALLMLLACTLIVRYVAKRIAEPLDGLNKQAENIRRFVFTKSHYSRSMIKEVNDLSMSVELMEHTLHDLIILLQDTASNQDFSILAKNIAKQSYIVTKAETIVLSVWDRKTKKFEVAVNHAIIPLRVDMNTLLANAPLMLSQLKSGEVFHLNKKDELLKPYLLHFHNSDLYFFPLLNRDKQLVGVLTLGYERRATKLQKEKHDFLSELLNFAAIAKENIDQIQQQKDMLNAFTELLASTIDTKSPYTGGHCQRVPALAEMLTLAAAEDQGQFRDFSMDSKQWEELSLGAWMHDCGKITTPEYVVDKATKLETNYDRIHEIRMRFELLKQQAHTDYWKAVSQGSDAAFEKLRRDKTLHSLDDDFAFIAECNIGSEFMNDSKFERLQSIAQLTWKRTIDDKIGISWVEKDRCDNSQALPVTEFMLSNKAVHKVAWPLGHNPKDTWEQPFNLVPGEYQYDRGELYNLSVRVGTLTSEERFIINNHIVQTIHMLEKLPYPEHMKNVPEIAGCHHERMDGEGYPRGQKGSELSVQARVMAIADIFEALTANDRPYKKAKNLRESLSIMTQLATTGHIDPDLYVLFLGKGVYKQYADKFLEQTQLVDVNIDNYLEQVNLYLAKQKFDKKQEEDVAG
ncbi:HD domain-containing phosphohydrolase [Vibrio tapetis subsp. quintayensis]|uniref:HD domain-containing phosphohydrolase n=1 Tax=Vibrio tapetis TaxID=52443 RepID=UPI0025B4FA13|nr:HD domain-containing phosphohydrolase [Vibrio tapetis]MDN3683070.1 HD domain-containing phosphohydrolase [Vibrio tapetis subsp. quintayensis]